LLGVAEYDMFQNGTMF